MKDILQISMQQRAWAQDEKNEKIASFHAPCRCGALSLSLRRSLSLPLSTHPAWAFFWEESVYCRSSSESSAVHWQWRRRRFHHPRAPHHYHHRCYPPSLLHSIQRAPCRHPPATRRSPPAFHETIRPFVHGAHPPFQRGNRVLPTAMPWLNMSFNIMGEYKCMSVCERERERKRENE